MKRLLFGFAALPFLAGVAFAGEPLNDEQLDRVTAGATCPDGFTNCSSGNGSVSICTGCTGGQVFVPTSPQTLFSDVNAFLKQVGYSSSCSTSTC